MNNEHSILTSTRDFTPFKLRGGVCVSHFSSVPLSLTHTHSVLTCVSLCKRDNVYVIEKEQVEKMHKSEISLGQSCYPFVCVRVLGQYMCEPLTMRHSEALHYSVGG